MRWQLRHGIRVLTLIALAVLCLTTPLRAQPFAAMVMDARTGEVLHSTNADTRLHPASLTKMMTLYIAFEAVENGEIDLDTRVRISQTAAGQPPSRLGLRAGQRITFRHLIRAAALRSANDAATAIAEALEGSVSNFADRMNRTAAALGMSRTRFRNPHGLTQDGHMSTARDMSILGRHLYFDYPGYYNLFSRLSEDAGIATVRNTNRRLLQSYRGADGIKTGFTNAAGYNLTAMAERDGVRILVTVMGARSSAHRHQQVTDLLNRGFREAPRRASTRAPSPPRYVPGAEDQGSGVAAGRVIRLQRAPTSSLFPRARPDPNAPPPPEMLAAISESVGQALQGLQTTGEDPDMPDQEATETPQALTALERSPMPPPRPERVETDHTDYAADAEASLPADPDAMPEVEIAAADPQPDVSEAEPRAPEQPALAEDAPAESQAPQQFAHDPALIAQISVENGVIVIPGLPAIVPQSDPQAMIGDAPGVDTPPIALNTLPEIEPARSGLIVDETGRILWRDEPLLNALQDDAAAELIVPPTIVLTSADDRPDSAVATAPTQIVAMVSTSGGRLFGVELGRYGSISEADRVLLRLSLSEGGVLGTGARSTQAVSGQYAARVEGLTEAEADAVCARLSARAQPCTVLVP